MVNRKLKTIITVRKYEKDRKKLDVMGYGVWK
jgi:hypothetical protein